MPKYIIEFTLPEEREEFEIAIQAGKFHSALWDLSNEIRSRTKHLDDKSTTWDEVRELFHEVLNESGVEL